MADSCATLSSCSSPLKSILLMSADTSKRWRQSRGPELVVAFKMAAWRLVDVLPGVLIASEESFCFVSGLPFKEVERLCVIELLVEDSFPEGEEECDPLTPGVRGRRLSSELTCSKSSENLIKASPNLPSIANIFTTSLALV